MTVDFPSLPTGDGYPHGANLAKKIVDAKKAPTGAVARATAKAATLYLAWREAAEAVEYIPENLKAFSTEQARLFDVYRNHLDKPEFDKAFDSRGALQSSALEELCRYLLDPVVTEILEDTRPDDLVLGHYDVYQGMFFTAPGFVDFSRLPAPHFPKVNMDFVIAKRIEIAISAEGEQSPSRPIYLPAVGIECKTYLDRTRYHGADGNATTVKGGVPGCLYVLLAEMLKLDVGGVNVHGSRIDHIYILRKSKNIDLKKRRAEGLALKPLDPLAICDLVTRVREHLRHDWSEPEQWEESGKLK